jgi:hypothetical protein
MEVKAARILVRRTKTTSELQRAVMEQRLDNLEDRARRTDDTLVRVLEGMPSLTVEALACSVERSTGAALVEVFYPFMLRFFKPILIIPRQLTRATTA